MLVSEGPRFEVASRVEGVLRARRAHELSDGSLRYIAVATALFSPRPPPVIVLNEPEASLHPSLLVPLARAMRRAAKHAQVWVVTHSETLASALREGDDPPVADIVLERADDGATRLRGQRLFDLPSWPE